jgi:hypothetical protein
LKEPLVLKISGTTTISVKLSPRASKYYAPAQVILPRIKFSLSSNSEKTPLSSPQIIEVISASAFDRRISNNRSKLIGNLVNVSQSKLPSAELLKIYSKLANVKGVDINKSES